MHQDFKDDKKCDELVGVETVKELFNFTMRLTDKKRRD